MSFIAWILLGMVAGVLGSTIVTGRGEGVLVSLLLGVAGAFGGGLLFEVAGSKGITGFNLWSLLVATVGSIVLLIGYHIIRPPRRLDG